MLHIYAYDRLARSLARLYPYREGRFLLRVPCNPICRCARESPGMARDTRNCSDLWEGHGTVNEWKPWKCRRDAAVNREEGEEGTKLRAESRAIRRSSRRRKVHVAVHFRLNTRCNFGGDLPADFPFKKLLSSRSLEKRNTQSTSRCAALPRAVLARCKSENYDERRLSTRSTIGVCVYMYVCTRGTRLDGGFANVFRCRSKSRPTGRLLKISDDEWNDGQPVIQKQCTEWIKMR